MKEGEGISFWGFEKCQNTRCTIGHNAPSAGVSLCNCRNLGGLASTRLSRFLLSSSIAHQTTPIVSLNQGYGSIWTLWCVPSLPLASALSPSPAQARANQPHKQEQQLPLWHLNQASSSLLLPSPAKNVPWKPWSQELDHNYQEQCFSHTMN